METNAPQGGVQPVKHYEFDAQQDKVIGDLASAMRWVALPFNVLGFLYVIATVFCVVQAFLEPRFVFPAIYVGLLALLLLAMGRWTSHAAASFQRVVSTSGQDISHLMGALDNLRKMYSLLSVFVKVYVAIILAALVLTLIVLVVAALR